MLDWYIPWARIDWPLRIQLLIWVFAVVFAYWISWRTLVRKQPWLVKQETKKK
jgi:hypothetical protein